MTAFVTPYIKTTSAAVTRATPQCYITGSNFTNIWNAAQGTLVVSGIKSSTSLSSTDRMISANDGTTANATEIFLDNTASGAVRSRVRASNVNLGIGDGSTALTANVLFKAALAYQTANMAASDRGLLSWTSSTAGAMPILTQLGIGMADNATGPFNGWIQSASYYSARLANASIQGLTT